MNSNYELFSLKKPTTLKKLEQAKKVLILQEQPDKNQTEGPEKIEEYTEKFKSIEPAYERIKESIKSEPKPKVKKSETKEEMKDPRTKEEWLLQKSAFPNKYTMTPNGDLSTSRGMVIELIPKVPASVEYINKQFASNKTELEAAQKSYTEAKRILYELIQGYNASSKNSTDSSLVMIANQKVRDAECLISALTKEPRSAVILERLVGRDLQINNNHDVARIADPVVSGVYTTFHWKNFWMDKSDEKIPELVPDQEPLEGGAKPKKEKTEEQKAAARKWAIINARRRNSFK